MKHTIHVHQQKIRNGVAAIIDRTYRGSTHHTLVTICCPNCGSDAAQVIQTAEPDSCGARVTIKTTGDVRHG